MSLSINYPNRIEKIRRKMRESGIQAILCTRLQSICYVAGVLVPAPWRGGVLVPLEGDVRLIAMDSDLSRQLKDTWIESIVTWNRPNPMSFVKAAVEALKAANCTKGKIAVEMNPPMVAGLLMVPEYNALRESFPAAELIDGIGLLDSIMVIKEPVEIELIKRAVEIADYGLLEAFKAIAPGVTENEVAGVAEWAMRKAGSSWHWAETTGTEVGSGERSAFRGGVCQPATNKLIQLGDTVVVDVHSMYDLYLCDTCGTAVAGTPTSEQERLGEAWSSIAWSVIRNLRPGMRIGDVARAALKKAEELGYLEQTVHTFGHGLGTAVGGLAPFIWEGSDQILEPSTLVIVLTAVSQPGVGGARLELPVLVTDGEPEVLAKFPIELVTAG